MSDIRCPMCGKSNPADSEICQHCGAQIRPKHINSFEEELPGSEDQISWLRNLQGSPEELQESGDAEEQWNIPEESDEGMPDWLTRIRERSRFEEQAAARAAVEQNDPGEDQAKEDIPDWMQDLHQQEQSKPEPDSASGSDDWLGSLRSVEMSNEEQDVQGVEQSDSDRELPLEDQGEGQVMDRLSALAPEPLDAADSDSPVESIDNEEPFSETSQNDLQDWLNKLDAARPSQDAEDHEASVPDWLNASSPEEETPDSRDVPAGEGVPDWLKWDQETSPEAISQSEDFIPEASQPEQIESESAEDVPDWLRTPESQSPEEPEAQSEDLQVEEKPDWLSEIEDEVFEETFSEEASEGETPDWINLMESEPDSPVETAAVWQEEAQKQVPPGEASFERKDSAPGFEGDLEEDLLAGAASLSGLGSENVVSEPLFGESSQEISGDEAGEIEAPVSTKESLFGSDEELTKTEAVSPFLEEDLPDWLLEAHEEDEPELPSEETVQAFTLEEPKELKPESSSYPFAGEDAPDWLSEEAGLTDMEGAIKEVQEEDEIAPAQMPSWLQAMRPVEAVAPGKAHPRKPSAVEKAGPLAGLQGVLPAEDLATRYRKPPVYSTKLRVTESQKTHAGLFENILEQESQPKAARSERIQASQWVVRLIIAALLIGVLVLPMLVNPINKPLALTFPAESVVNFYQQLEALPDGAPVLVAFDYDPGFAGEMRFSAAGTLERLISKHARIAAISTVAQGPVLGEDLMQKALQQASAAQPELTTGYVLNEQTINLGYLAGGLASLQEFSIRPQQTIQYGFDSGVDGESVWSKPALRGVNQPDDFAMVIVITDNVDTGRSWIEQVQPVLGTTPMLLVTSAQASPMLLPYLQSGQVKGLLSGMSGGMAYEKLAGLTKGSASYFNAYQYAMILGVAFVLLGLFFKILVSLFARRKAKSEA